jgi:hypothetical protein
MMRAQFAQFERHEALARASIAASSTTDHPAHGKPGRASKVHGWDRARSVHANSGSANMNGKLLPDSTMWLRCGYSLAACAAFSLSVSHVGVSARVEASATELVKLLPNIVGVNGEDIDDWWRAETVRVVNRSNEAR